METRSGENGLGVPKVTWGLSKSAGAYTRPPESRGLWTFSTKGQTVNTSGMWAVPSLSQMLNSALVAWKQPSVQFSSVTQSCPTLCDPMNRSTPGLPVHHQLPEFTQTHVHGVGDAIQPSHPLSPLRLLPPIPPSIRIFSSESTIHMRWPKYWSFSFNISPSNEHPGLISFRMDWLDLSSHRPT